MKTIKDCINNKMCMEQLYKKTIIFTMLLLWVIVLNFMYIQFSDIDVIETEGLYQVDKKEVYAGEQINVHQRYCKKVDVAGDFRVYFKDGVYFLFRQFTSKEAPGCQDVWVAYTVPETLPPGEYQILYIINYKISPFKEVQEEIQSEFFSVLKHE